MQIYNKTEIVFISTFPPKVCGIAGYTQDLIKSLQSKFGESFKAIICPLETEEENYKYEEYTEYKLNISDAVSYLELASKINRNDHIGLVMLQHEFSFFNETRNGLYLFLRNLKKELIITFHTVLPKPDDELKDKVKEIAGFAKSIIVMTAISAEILCKDYDISSEKITIIPRGTHLLPFTDKTALKEKYGLTGKKVLSTFGLLSSGKNIQTTLKALPEIIIKNPKTIFLILGKTHPSIVRKEGERYREFLEDLIWELHLEHHIRFINEYLPLPELLEYLQLTDIYLFTSKDRNQTVSGTFSYAVSSGCAIVSTPIPYALEVLKEDTGIIIDFEAPEQLAAAVNTLLGNETKREKLRAKSLEKMAPTAWENSSIAHALLFQKIKGDATELTYTLPEINLDHIQNMTTDFGIIQFSDISKPNIDSGYTLDDNAQVMIAVCRHFEITKDKADLQLISIYLHFIEFCQQKDGSFLNYISKQKQFIQHTDETHLEDSNGKAVWSLGYLISLKAIFPQEFSETAEIILQKNLTHAEKIRSAKAIAFIIKGLYYQNSEKNIPLLRNMAERLVKMYRHEAKDKEVNPTYGNSVFSEALLYAWMTTGDDAYKQIAEESLKFLLSHIMTNDDLNVISNKERPIDVAYIILTLSAFYKAFNDDKYLQMMMNSFNWFLGKNHLNQIIYNPVTGGCYDELQEKNVNINQGAASTIGYLMARLSVIN